MFIFYLDISFQFELNSEGVELLCLIDLVFDACRYLQDNDQWEKAAWLAKMRLNTDEYIEVIKRWVEYLLSSKRKVKMINLYKLIESEHS